MEHKHTKTNTGAKRTITTIEKITSNSLLNFLKIIYGVNS